MNEKKTMCCQGKPQHMERFLEVCLLLLLYDEIGYGYGLIDQLGSFGFSEGDLNMGTLYRTLRFFHWLDEYRKHLHPHLNTVIETFHKLSPAIRNSFRTNLTNGIVEGMNNKIKLIKRVSYGYRSFLNFRTRIMLCFTLTKKTAQPRW